MNLDELVIRLFELLETKEESDSGHIFHPTYISSCRAMVCEELGTLLPNLKSLAYETRQLREMQEMNL